MSPGALSFSSTWYMFPTEFSAPLFDSPPSRVACVAWFCTREASSPACTLLLAARCASAEDCAVAREVGASAGACADGAPVDVDGAAGCCVVACVDCVPVVLLVESVAGLRGADAGREVTLM